MALTIKGKLQALLARNKTTGNVFFVDPINGDDNNDGTLQERAFATLQTGIDACTANTGCMIIRMRGSEVVTEATLCNKAGITIVACDFGMNNFNPEKFYHTGIDPSTGTPSFDAGPPIIISQPCTIIGLTFIGGKSTTQTYVAGTAGNHYSESVAASPACMAIAGGGSYYGGYNHIKNCKFVGWAVARNGIEQAAGGYNLIEDCWFESLTAGYAPRVNGYGNPAHDVIKNNHFVDCTAGIELFEPDTNAVTPSYMTIEKNRFLSCTKALDLNGNSGCTGVIAHNILGGFTKDTFADVNLAGVQAAGFKVVSNYYEET